MEDKILNLNELIKKGLPSTTQILEKDITNLTAPGENYWSDMFKIDLTLKNQETGATDHLSVCAKCVMAENQEGMLDNNVDMFKSEINFYKETVPTMQKFLADHGLPEITFFPELVGARLNLEDHGQPDKNAVLILENLKTKGYDNLDRHKGFDLDASKIILNDLAVFHAVPLAIKLKDPQTFKEKMSDNCMEFKPPQRKEGEPKRPDGPPPFPKELFKKILGQDTFCRKHLEIFDKFVEEEQKRFASGRAFESQYEGAFATLIHRDMWLNNTMQLLEDGKVVKNKFLDFQMYAIDNPATDLLFFLFSSVDLPTLQNHFDYLLSIYHERFIKTLEALGCDTKPYAYRYFLGALKDGALEKFLHTNLMNISVIFAKKGERQDFHKNNEIQVSDVHPVARSKLCFMFSEWVKRDWCY